MICPNCEEPKEEKDFYHHKGGWKCNPNCKTCLSKKHKKKKEMFAPPIKRRRVIKITDFGINGFFSPEKYARYATTI